ncbi:ATP-dependent 6-phosphofructokinase 3 [Glycine max]|nr:ATP-dependent 6-phosphofructokinase 3 [Glycine max]
MNEDAFPSIPLATFHSYSLYAPALQPYLSPLSPTVGFAPSLLSSCKTPVSTTHQRITERQNHIVITNRMWARLLSSTNQPSFLDAKGDNEEKEEEEALN